ncbi:MAG: PLD nuclease N-terminal domain-containing protein [Methylobacter sp.]|nr:PLD nuclease N-terminal domain-containing protein [Methylobacter sp.]
MGIEVGGLLGLIILVLDIWAIVSVLKSSDSNGKKALWVVLILLMPIIGLILWWLMGPRGT